MNSCKRDCLSFLLKIVYHFLGTQLYEKSEKEPWTIIENAQNEKANQQKVQVLQLDSKISQKLCSETPFNGNHYFSFFIFYFLKNKNTIFISHFHFYETEFPEIMLNLINSRCEEMKRQIEKKMLRSEEAKKQDSQIVHYSIYLLVGSLLRTPALLDVLFSMPKFEENLLEILNCPERTIRNEITWRLCELSRNFKNDTSNPSKQTPSLFFLKLILSHLPSTEEVSHHCEHFFLFLNDLLSFLSEKEVEEVLTLFPQKFPTHPKITNRILSFSIDWLKNRKTVEKTVFDKQDYVTSGYLSLILNLLKKSNDNQLCQYIG